MEVKFDYTNWRGKKSTKRVIPKALTFFDIPGNVNEALTNYPPGFFLEAFDLDKQQLRHYYLGGDPERRFNALPGEGFPIPFGDLGLIQAAVQGLEKHVVEIEVAGQLANIKATPVGKKETSPVLSSLAAKYLHYGALDLCNDLGLPPDYATGQSTATLVTAIRALAGSVLSQDETPA